MVETLVGISEKSPGKEASRFRRIPTGLCEQLQTLRGGSDTDKDRDMWVLPRARMEPLLAQGVGQKFPYGSPGNLVSIMLEGEVNRGWTGTLAGSMHPRPDWHAICHGPNYVLLHRSALNLAPNAGHRIDAAHHAAYIVQNDECRRELARLLVYAGETGIIDRTTTLNRLLRLVTYIEFAHAPKGVFSRSDELDEDGKKMQTKWWLERHQPTTNLWAGRYIELAHSWL